MGKFYFLMAFLSWSFTCMGQIVLNELMADPSPVVGLPEAEYIELYNASTLSVSIENWAISDASTSRTFGAEIIEPFEYVLVVSAANVDLFAEFGRVIAVSSLPSLNNSDDEITLRDENGDVIDRVAYASSWYNDALRDDGGYSLERINPENNCDESANWGASLDSRGGSPGSENSIYNPSFQDDSPLNIQLASVLSEMQIQLTFSKKVNPSTALQASNYSISEGIGSPENVSLSADGRSIVLETPAALLPGVIYTISINQILDCPLINSLSTSVLTAIPQPAQPGDLFINEILFNPKSGGVDYVELFNASSKILAVRDITLLELDAITEELLDFENFNESRHLMFPDTYWVLTSDTAIITERFNPENPNQFVEAAIPNYPDDRGGVVILNAALDTLDKVIYNADWHYSLITEEDGVALERLSINAPSQDPQNWFSASFTTNNGTPTYQNTQTRPNILQESQLQISPQVFTPDLDGFNDQLSIIINVEAPVTATIAVYNMRGNMVRNIVNNQILGFQNQVVWDGLNGQGNALPIGHYIILANWFDAQGNQGEAKQKITLSRRNP